MRKRRLTQAKAMGEWVKSGNLTTVNLCRRCKCPQTLKVLESPESVFKEKGARWKFRTKLSCHRRKMLKVLGKCHEIHPGLGFCGCIWELWKFPWTDSELMVRGESRLIRDSHRKCSNHTVAPCESCKQHPQQQGIWVCVRLSCSAT